MIHLNKNGTVDAGLYPVLCAGNGFPGISSDYSIRTDGWGNH